MTGYMVDSLANTTGKAGAQIREIAQKAYNLIRITQLCVTSQSQSLINAQHLMAIMSFIWEDRR
jgi:hypothetical protein